ncbi:carboxylesterase family protein [Metarhizium brunneum]
MPNAGLYDQALLFEWVREHIDKVKGDKDKVSAWGVSAGRSSILHHLIRDDGARDPLFQSFAAFSPGFEWAWNNTDGGKLDTIYKSFVFLKALKVKDVFKYKKSTAAQIVASKVFGMYLPRQWQKHPEQVIQGGLFPAGPAVDGKWVKTMPLLALAQGSYWKQIDSAIVSLVTNESGPFILKGIVDQAPFDKYLAEFLPGDALDPQRSLIEQEYDCQAVFDGDFQACAGAVIEHLFITCNTRYLADAYPDKTYAMQYAFPLDQFASHGVDLIPLFANDFEEAKAFLLALDLEGITEQMAEIYAGWLTHAVTLTYQGFYASFDVSGDPNTLLESAPLKWSPVDAAVMHTQAF